MYQQGSGRGGRGERSAGIGREGLVSSIGHNWKKDCTVEVKSKYGPRGYARSQYRLCTVCDNTNCTVSSATGRSWLRREGFPDGGSSVDVE